MQIIKQANYMGQLLVMFIATDVTLVSDTYILHYTGLPQVRATRL